MKKQLILHIGTHKTGTSAIQSWLTAQREELRRIGVWYGRTDRPPLANLPKHNSFYRALTHPKGDFETEKHLILEDFASSGCDTLILSEEGLSLPSFDKFARVREFCDVFDITVICFVRRQDQFVESWWNQKCKEGQEKRMLLEFANGPELRKRLDFCRILDFWAEFASVKVVNYDANKGGGSIARFAAAAGLPYRETALRQNISPSLNCAAFMCFLNRHGIRFKEGVLVHLFRRDRRRYGLGSVLRSDILAQVADSNARLERKYGISFSHELPKEEDKPLRYPSLKSLFLAGIEALRYAGRQIRKRQLRGGKRNTPG